jgi:hypothetical protein
LRGAYFTEANLRGANLADASLISAHLVETNLELANLMGCHIYGISAWNLNLNGANQSDLIITPPDESTVTVDNVEVGQFIYMLLSNEKVREVIDALTSKVVLILGRFTPERKAALDGIREELRRRDYLPILLDFVKPHNRDLTETISALAHLSRFIIADITDTPTITEVLQLFIPNVVVPVQPLIQAESSNYSMFSDFRRYSWILPVYHYANLEELILSL